MKDILIHFSNQSLRNNAIFDGEDFNGLQKPWRALREKLGTLGYRFRTADDNTLDTCAAIVFFDSDSLTPTSRNLYKEALEKGFDKNLALILWETESVKKGNYSPELYKKFSTIFTWNDALVDNKKFFKFCLPYPHRKEISPVHYKEKKTLVNISINKESRGSDELYTHRRKSVSFFEKHLKEEFDLFGYRWNQPINKWQKLLPFLVRHHPRYQGICQDKISVLSKYKFALCYENTRGLQGYITEKIFDCFNAKTIPIYWGAENIKDYVDEAAFIDRRKFKTDQELLDFLLKMDESTYNKYIQAITTYLTSARYKSFLPEHFASTLSQKLLTIAK